MLESSTMKPTLFLAALAIFLPFTNPAAQDARKPVDVFNLQFVESCRHFDPAGTAALWADDGVDLLPGMDPIIGKSAISKWLSGLSEQVKGTKVVQCDIDWKQIQISGDVAYEWGINTQTVSAPGQPEPFKNKGKITLIVRKQADGPWKLELESWNSSPQAR